LLNKSGPLKEREGKHFGSVHLTQSS